MSAQPGWYPDPGGVPNLYRYWDGRAWSSATSADPRAAQPAPGPIPGQPGSIPGQPGSIPGQPGSIPGQPAPYPGSAGGGQRRSALGWWIAAAALVVVVAVIGVLAVRAIGRSGGIAGSGPANQPSQDVCPTSTAQPTTGQAPPNDGRVHGGPVSYPLLGDPWSKPEADPRVPFGRDVQKQWVMDQENYDGEGSSWVSSVLVAELMAGDGFFTPEQGAQIVVRCILGAFYGDNPVSSDVKVNEAATIDGHDAWLIESQLSFDIPGLAAKGELLIVAVVNAGESAGLFYASIPDTQPELVKPAREALAGLTVDT